MRPLATAARAFGLASTLLILSACAAENSSKDRAAANLTDTYWKLIQLKGEPAALGAGDQEAHLLLSGTGGQARGYAGCNNFAGDFETDGSTMTFGPLAATKKLCFEGMKQEDDFLNSLDATKRFTISGATLTLFGDGGEALLRFEADPLQ